MTATYDALVVGAGYVGCAIAARLAAAGLRTALIERRTPGAGGSGANYGSVQVQDCELGASIPLTVAGAACFPHLEEELGATVGYRPRGSLLVIETESQWHVMAARLPMLHAAGVRAELAPRERLAEIEPLLSPRHALGACYYEGEGQVRPFQFIQAHLRAGRRCGLALHRETEVTGFEIEGGRLAGVQTNRGRFSAPVAVLATGAWTPRLGRLLKRDWAIRHVHGQAVVTERSELTLRTHISSAAFFEAIAETQPQSNAVLAVGQSHEGHFLLGEAGRTTEDLGSRATGAGQAAIAAEIGRFFPSLTRLRVLRGWAAPVAYTPDGRPFLGPVAGVDGLILATAFKSTVIVTPLISRLVAQLVTTGRTELDLSAFSPERQLIGTQMTQIAAATTDSQDR